MNQSHEWQRVSFTCELIVQTGPDIAHLTTKRHYGQGHQYFGTANCCEGYSCPMGGAPLSCCQGYLTPVYHLQDHLSMVYRIGLREEWTQGVGGGIQSSVLVLLQVDDRARLGITPSCIHPRTKVVSTAICAEISTCLDVRPLSTSFRSPLVAYVVYTVTTTHRKKIPSSRIMMGPSWRYAEPLTRCLLY